MKIQAILKALFIVSFVTLLGCGGGGGGGGGTTAPPPVAAKTSVSGTVSFPTLSALVGKQVTKEVTKSVALPSGTTVRAYTLDGIQVGEATGANLNLTTGEFKIADLPPGVDYVVKAVSGGQVLRKLIEKTVVAPNTDVVNQDLSAISTAAVTVASQKLAALPENSGLTNLVLGDPITLNTTQKTALSDQIFQQVSPQALEQQITTAQATLKNAILTTDYTAINQQSLIDLVNTLNIVIAAIDKNTDPLKLITDSTVSIDVSASAVKQFTLADPSAPTTLTTVTKTVVEPIITKSIDTYVPPSRVQLDVGTDVQSGKLFGLILDITMPSAALMPASSVLPSDAAGLVDVAAKIRLAAGLDLNTRLDVVQWDAGTRKLRLQIASAYALPTGQLFSLLTDRTVGQTLDAQSFTVTTVKAIDDTGSVLVSGFNYGKTVTTSGL